MKNGPIIVAFGAAVANGLKLKFVPHFDNEEAERVAWNDCGGKGASASMKISKLAAKLEGATVMPRHWVRNAGQDCEHIRENGEHEAYEGHNGFDPPAVVFNRMCAGLTEAECTEGDNAEKCEFKNGVCGWYGEPHAYDHDHVFPLDRHLFSKTELALGAAEEITHAGIVELNAQGKHAGMEEMRAHAKLRRFRDESVARVGDKDLHEGIVPTESENLEALLKGQNEDDYENQIVIEQ